MFKQIFVTALLGHIFFLAATTFCFSQANNIAEGKSAHHLSVSDSTLVQRYLDSVNNTGVYSHKRQLYLDSVLAITPWRAAWWQQKAMPLFKEEKCEAGMPYLDSAVKYAPEKYLDYRAFMKCIFQKSYRASIKDFEDARKLVGAGGIMDHSYDFYIGLCYLQLNVFDSAQYYLERSIANQEKASGEKWVHYADLFYLGIVYYEKENYNQAMEMFDKSLKQYGNFPDAKYYKAICLKKLNQDAAALTLMKEAEEDFKQGYTLNEDNAIYVTYPYQKDKERYYTNAVKALDGNDH